MNSELMFSRKTDNWETPLSFFLELDREFVFGLDAAAMRENRRVRMYLGPDHENDTCRDALAKDWAWILGSEIGREAVWLNPPYSLCAEFVAKAAEERRKGVTTVMLIPSRTDTRYWHDHIWDREKHQPREGVEIRFIKGRLKFGDGKNSAPFPSVVVIFRGHK